jgi:D-sedoheptulose 7-phosphate isomerase
MDINKNIDTLIEILNRLKADLTPKMEYLADEIARSLSKGGKLLVMGNGGSAADAQHLAAEFVGKFEIERKPLAAMALTCNSSVLTSLANDFSFEEVFAKQIDALAKSEDIVIAISTSGNSKNVVQGIKKAKEKGCYTCALLGSDGGKLAGLVDIPLIVSSPQTPRIQECHILICHLLCSLVESKLG